MRSNRNYSNALDNFGIRFHAYNPLAGGAFSKSFGAIGAVAAGSRFDGSHGQGKLYRDRYWNDAYLDALAEINRSCEGHGFDAVLRGVALADSSLPTKCRTE
jgi:aflatoxin B1 aldehyde reductase